MSPYRNRLPQLENRPFLTDGGLETTLIFHRGLDLPCFAAFDLLKDEAGVATLREYFEPYLESAARHGAGFILEAPTWRANPDWAAKLGYGKAALAETNRRAIELAGELRRAYQAPERPIVVSGNLGPRGDGYRVADRMSAEQARAYHAAQIETFAGTEADMIAAFTMTYPEEAIGILNAAREAGMPAAISFTVETDGRLPSGERLVDAIRRTEESTDGYAAYFMINCAHPSHFLDVLGESGTWRERIRGLRANASRCSHAELDESTELDDGNPLELGEEYRELLALLPNLNVLGGCCGTDHRHVQAIAAACIGSNAQAA